MAARVRSAPVNRAESPESGQLSSSGHLNEVSAREDDVPAEMLRNLHEACCVVWHDLCRSSRSGLSTSKSRKLKNGLMTFYLFGDFLESPRLNDLRDQYSDLWDNILELLCDIGHSLDLCEHIVDNGLSQLICR